MPGRSRFLARSLFVASVVAAAPGASSAQGTSVLTLLPTEGRTLEVGREVAGALSSSDHLSVDDNFLEAWELTGRAGESVTIDLESDAFDARLYVVGPGLAETLSDDDGGAGCNSRLTFTFLEDGTFRVVASSLGSRQTGTYTIRVSEEPQPVPTYGCGEVDPALLDSLPTEGRTLELGSVASGQLSVLSPTIQEQRPGEAWRLLGQAGDRLSIVLESDAFDAYLYMGGPGIDGVLSDDDGAGELNSRIDVTLPTDGPFTVVASALSAGSAGAYTIRVEEGLDLGALPTDGRTIDLGQTVQGQLGFGDPVVMDGRRGQAWAFEGVAGQRVAIDQTSDDFDSYLYVVGPGILEPVSDDDGGDGLNSRITLTLPESGTYRIIVSALGSSGSGSFSLSVTPR